MGATFIFAKISKIRIDKLLAILLPPLVLFYGIAKIGCLCAGCCYGIPYNGVGAIVFNNELSSAPINQKLFPLQLIEASYNIAISIFVVFKYKKTEDTYKIIAMTLLLFGIGKFILTFFRGNQDEMLFLGVSITQYISILIAILGLAFIA